MSKKRGGADDEMSEMEEMEAVEMPRMRRAGAARPLSKWVLHVMEVWQEGKRSDPAYSYRQAMHDARSSYMR
jgi:hypothetical protein